MPCLADYRPLLTLSQAMVAQARACQWEALAASETQRHTLIKQQDSRAPTPPNEADDIRVLLEEIQRCDAIVREHVAAWQEPVRRYILRDSSAA